MADIIVPKRREDIFRPDGDLTLRFLRWMELVTDTTNTTTTIVVEEVGEEAIINRALSTRPAQLFNQQVQINASNDRIEANEIDLATRPRMSDLFKTNQRIDELIDELIEQNEKLLIGSESQQESACLQVQILKQMKLLNLRTEEAFNTKINEGDIE